MHHEIAQNGTWHERWELVGTVSLRSSWLCLTRRGRGRAHRWLPAARRQPQPRPASVLAGADRHVGLVVEEGAGCQVLLTLHIDLASGVRLPPPEHG